MAGEGIAQALGECSHAFGVGADGDTQSLFSVLPLSLLGWSCPHLPEERFINCVICCVAFDVCVFRPMPSNQVLPVGFRTERFKGVY